MAKKLLLALAALLLLLASALGALALYARSESARIVQPEAPHVKADRRPEAIERGAAIFYATCVSCHRPAKGQQASGAPMLEVPAWIGSLHSGNITADPVAGIGAVSDELRGRMIRTGRTRDGRWAPMPTYALSDADLAAVLGFLRSDDPLFAPNASPVPRSELTTVGSMVLALTGAFDAPAVAASIPAVAEGPTVAYGRYLAEDVYKCGDCHTPGFDAKKSEGPDAYIGGGELTDAAGKTLLSANLTKHPEAGIGRWSRDHFADAVRSGVRPDGSPVNYPMPRFRGARDVEIDAVLAYLRSFPASPNRVPGRVPAKIPSAPQAHLPSVPRSPEQLFTALGCVGCHGSGAPFEDRLTGATGRSDEDVAAWILNPERFRPGTLMPTFAGKLSQEEAVALAGWVKARPRGLTATVVPKP